MSVSEPKYRLQIVYFLGTRNWRGVLKIKREGTGWGKGKNKAKSGKALSIVTTNPSGTFVWNSSQQARTQGFCLHRHCFWWQVVSLLTNYSPHPGYSLTTGGFDHRVIASGEFVSFKHSLQIWVIEFFLCPSNLIFATWPASCQSNNFCFQRKIKVS